MVNNNLRISGLASGMDTESIVKKLMDAERIPLNKIHQKRQWTEWQRDAFRDVNTQLLDFRTSMENLRLQSSFNKSKVSSTDTTKIDVSISGSPSQSVYNITQATLYKPGNPSSLKIGTNLANDTTQLGVGEGFSFTLNGQAITLSDTDTIQSAITKINAVSSQSHVSASYSSGDKAIVFSATDSTTTVSITGTTNTVNNPAPNPISNVLNIADGDGSAPTAATNGSITINGVSLTLTSNSFTYDGINYTLKSDINSALQINKTTDTDSIFNSIKTFVDKYNNVIKSLNDKIGEKKNRDYPPLLDDQKAAMKDTDITLWENKAKSGLLSNDSIISGLLNNMRTALYTTVSGVNTNVDLLKDIGITTSTSYQDKGKLVLDEDKLKGMLNTNLDDVKALFTKTFDTGNINDTTANNSTKSNNSGLAWRIYDQLNASIKAITNKAGTTSIAADNSLLGKDLRTIDDQILDWQDRLAQKEDRYWAQFNAMEQAIQKSNSQSGWLAQQFGGGN